MQNFVNDAMLTAKDDSELVPQLLPALTVIVPPEVPKFTVIEAVPCPVNVAPDGTVQL